MEKNKNIKEYTKVELHNILVNTRDESLGISLYDVAQEIKDVYDDAEINALINHLNF